MTPIAQRAEPAAASLKWRPGRASLAAKLAFGFIGLVALVLIVNGAIDAWLSYSQAKRAALEVQSEKARAAAERVGVFLDEIQTQLGWTAGVEWGYAKLEQQRYDFIRLLRQAPAITALSYIDGKGREQLAVSRLEPDAVASGKDLSADPSFVRAVADKVWFGPVEFRRGSEPYMTVALAHVGKTPGVTVADVNLKLVWDVVSAIHVGDKGFAYVVDEKGRLIAHPDLSLVLRDTDFSALPQVAAALAGGGTNAAEVARSLDGTGVLTAHAVAPKTHWTVFVEQPLAEALATAYRSLLRSLALLGLGLALAAVSGVALARRMAAPIRLLQAGAEKLGSGDLTQRLDIRTGDEIEALAGGFNRMAQRLQESYENLEGKVEARTHDLNEALAQQTATADVLKTISRSAFDLQPVLDTLIGSAVKLIGGLRGAICLRDGLVYAFRATYGETPEFDAWLRQHPAEVGRGSVVGRVALSGRVEQIPDTAADKEHLVPAKDYRSVIGAPLLRDGETVGVVVVVREAAGFFDGRQIELLQTFADQAVIAIENARLFEEVQARTRDLSEALERQTATAEVLKVISRSAFGLKQVLQTLVDSAVRLCAQDGVIYLRDGDVFRAEAAFGAEVAGRDPRGRSPRRPGRDSITGRVALSGRVEQIPDNEADPEFQVAPAQRMNMRALLGVPLLRNGEVEGVFVLAKPDPGLFSERAVELVRTFADQAVIAIENARLFQEVQEALEQQKASAGVLSAIGRSVSDASPVFEEILSACQRLFGSHEMGIYTVDADEMVRVAAWRGERRAEVRHDVTPVAESITGRIIRERRVHHIPDLLADPNLTPLVRERAERLGSASLLYAPCFGRTVGWARSWWCARRPIPLPSAKRRCFAPSPTRRRLRSRTRGCSRRFRRARATSPRRWSGRRRRPKCFRR